MLCFVWSLVSLVSKFCERSSELRVWFTGCDCAQFVSIYHHTALSFLHPPPVFFFAFVFCFSEMADVSDEKIQEGVCFITSVVTETYRGY